MSNDSNNNNKISVNQMILACNLAIHKRTQHVSNLKVAGCSWIVICSAHAKAISKFTADESDFYGKLFAPYSPYVLIDFDFVSSLLASLDSVVVVVAVSIRVMC